MKADKTAITASAPTGPGRLGPAAPAAPAAPPAASVRHYLGKAFKALASLKLTVILFALSMFLVFAGTLAQADQGIWTVVSKYFRSLFVWIPLRVFFPGTWNVPGGLPFPGGWLLGTLLLINLLAAQTRMLRNNLGREGFRWGRAGIVLAVLGGPLVALHQALVRSNINLELTPLDQVILYAFGLLVPVLIALLPRKAGIILLHAGLVVMMLGELVAGLYQVEGNLTIEENRTANFLEHRTSTELAIIDPSDPARDRVVGVPASLLRPGAVVRDDRLPFVIEVNQYMPNSAAPREVPAGIGPGSAANPATAGDGLSFLANPAREASGTESSVDLASAYLTFRDKATGDPLGTYMLSVWFSGALPDIDLPQRVKVGDTGYDVYLRFKRSYKPYEVYLYKFEHDKYLGTDTPKNYASHVRLRDESQGEDRDAYISMNNPLRYRGETFYQADFLKDGRRGTVLQVVRNPGWLMPYVSCALVSFGMLVHFGMHLVGFLGRRAVA